MQTKPPGTACRLSPYVTKAIVAPGHYLVSSGASCYFVTAARLIRDHADRWRLDCLRCLPGDIPDGATVHPLYWNRRK